MRLQVSLVIFWSFLMIVIHIFNAGKLNVKPEQIKGVFSDIEVILNYNTKLLEDLEPIVTNWSATSRLGSTFISMVIHIVIIIIFC